MVLDPQTGSDVVGDSPTLRLSAIKDLQGERFLQFLQGELVALGPAPVYKPFSFSARVS